MLSHVDSCWYGLLGMFPCHSHQQKKMSTCRNIYLYRISQNEDIRYLVILSDKFIVFFRKRIKNSPHFFHLANWGSGRNGASKFRSVSKFRNASYDFICISGHTKNQASDAKVAGKTGDVFLCFLGHHWPKHLETEMRAHATTDVHSNLGSSK